MELTRPEPPRASQTVPFIGSIIDLLCDCKFYFLQFSKQTNGHIFTIPLPDRSIYIVTRPEFAQLVMKQLNALSWESIVVEYQVHPFGSSSNAKKLYEGSTEDTRKKRALLPDIPLFCRSSLNLGKISDDMNIIALQKMRVQLDSLKPAYSDRQIVSLYRWIHDTITSISSDVLWGSENPYKHPEVTEDFRAFQEEITSLLTNPVPSWTAWKALTARERLEKILTEYFEEGHDERASHL